MLDFGATCHHFKFLRFDDCLGVRRNKFCVRTKERISDWKTAFVRYTDRCEKIPPCSGPSDDCFYICSVRIEHKTFLY